MNDTILVTGECPTKESNPSQHPEFRKKFEMLFAPLQTEAYQLVKQGRSCALVAPTSSGKTLAVAAPLFESGRPAVFVLPFRSLILDQSQELVQIASLFEISEDKFGKLEGGDSRKTIADVVERCDYILITPDKLISLLIAGRDGSSAALNILSKYDFVFDEVHVYNAMMQTSLRYFLRSVMYWQELRRRKSGFYFLSATFPDEIRQLLKSEVGLQDDDFIEGVSWTGDVNLMIKLAKETAELIANDIKQLDIATDTVCIFNSAYRAYQVCEAVGGLLFIGQDKMSEIQRRANFNQFKDDPEYWALVGSPAIEAGVDFVARHLVIEESHQDSFIQRFGRAARSGKDAFVLAYSDSLFKLQKQNKLKKQYSRKEFLAMLGHEIIRREPTDLFTGLAAYAYYNFWNQDPHFPMDLADRSSCETLKDNGVENILAFRGLTPYTKYQSGEYIGFKPLFRKNLAIEDGKVRGAPHPAKYFATPNRTTPVIGKLLNIAQQDRSALGKVILAKVRFVGFGRSKWVLLEIIHATSVDDQDDNIRLEKVTAKGVYPFGRNSDGSKGQTLVRFYEVDV